VLREREDSEVGDELSRRFFSDLFLAHPLTRNASADLQLFVPYNEAATSAESNIKKAGECHATMKPR
jgi:hypothetical protein